MKKRILVVEDDAPLAMVIRDNLVFEGFEVRHVSDGVRAIDAARTFAPDLVLLDVMLPGKNGFDLCRHWRQPNAFPVIIVTAKGRKEEKLLGLKLGADDYVTKPFELEELVARVHAVLRRARPQLDTMELGSVRVDFVNLRASRAESPLELTHLEFSLLRYLAEHQDKVVHRDELLHLVWGYPDSPHTRCVDRAIARLRRKIETDPHRPEYVHTVHGDGYMLTPSRTAWPRGPVS